MAGIGAFLLQRLLTRPTLTALLTLTGWMDSHIVQGPPPTFWEDDVPSARSQVASLIRPAIRILPSRYQLNSGRQWSSSRRSQSDWTTLFSRPIDALAQTVKLEHPFVLVATRNGSPIANSVPLATVCNDHYQLGSRHCLWIRRKISSTLSQRTRSLRVGSAPWCRSRDGSPPQSVRGLHSLHHDTRRPSFSCRRRTTCSPTQRAEPRSDVPPAVGTRGLPARRTRQSASCPASAWAAKPLNQFSLPALPSACRCSASQCFSSTTRVRVRERLAKTRQLLWRWPPRCVFSHLA